MASTKRNQRFSKPKIQKLDHEISVVSVSFPNHFRCPISLDLMSDPVTVSTGITYDRTSIETWLATGSFTCPVTNQDIPPDEYLIPNHSLRRMIQDWCRSTGFDRIPTPKIPVTPTQASEILSEITACNDVRCRELTFTVGSLTKESERNRRCFVAAGAGKVFAAMFAVRISTVDLTEGMLSIIACMLPLDEDSCRYLGSAESLGRLVPMMRSECLASRLNAVLVLREVLSRGRQFVRTATKAEGLMESLVGLIKKPVSPRIAKAALTAAFFLVSSDERNSAGMVGLGLVNLVLDILVESEKGVCEKALMVFDEICGSAEGREEACGHALTVPVLAKKMFRVSEGATESVVSALWKICKRRGVLEEATQVGVFQKVLLLLQVGCSLETKEKATELLKLMNEYRGKLECVDVMDFKGLKKAF